MTIFRKVPDSKVPDRKNVSIKSSERSRLLGKAKNTSLKNSAKSSKIGKVQAFLEEAFYTTVQNRVLQFLTR